MQSIKYRNFKCPIFFVNGYVSNLSTISYCNLFSLMLSESQVLYDVRKILCQADYTPSDPMELCNRLLVTCYMATENSSQETKQRASQVFIHRVVLDYRITGTLKEHSKR